MLAFFTLTLVLTKLVNHKANFYGVCDACRHGSTKCHRTWLYNFILAPPLLACLFHFIEVLATLYHKCLLSFYNNFHVNPLVWCVRMSTGLN